MYWCVGYVSYVCGVGGVCCKFCMCWLGGIFGDSCVGGMFVLMSVCIGGWSKDDECECGICVSGGIVYILSDGNRLTHCGFVLKC